MNKRLPVIAIAAGDHAGIGPEITVKMLGDYDEPYIPLLVGDSTLLTSEAEKYAPDIVPRIHPYEPGVKMRADGTIYLFDVPKGTAVQYGLVNTESGVHSFKQMRACCKLCKDSVSDGFLLAPVTKKSLNLAEPKFTNEMDLFCEEFNIQDVRPVVRAGNITRCSVVSHVRFRDILDHITVNSVVDAGMDLFYVIKRLDESDAHVAMAAINPHGGDGGVFGDEEITILSPAVKELCERGMNIEGPFPADTVFHRALQGYFSSVLFMFHDQGNIAGKLAQFSDGVVIYSKVPYPIVTAAHGSATDIAGRGIAKHDNMKACMKWILQMISSILKEKKNISE